MNPKDCDVLNDCLHTGPKFNQRILEVLLRFQSYPVVFIGDNEKAFLMISVIPKVANPKHCLEIYPSSMCGGPRA